MVELPSILCETCHYWHSSDAHCPAPHSGPKFACSNHQNYDEFMRIVHYATNGLEVIPDDTDEEDVEMPDSIEAGDVELTRKETLQEMHAYLLKALRKAETILDRHQSGVWASGQNYIDRAEMRVKKWHRWCNLMAEIVAEAP